MKLNKPLETCNDEKGNIHRMEDNWHEQKKCNKCKCRCKPDGSFPPLCGCTRKRCHGTDQGSDIKVHQKSPVQIAVEKNTTCEDSEGKTRQVGEKWNGKQDCNSCQCNCGSDGKPHCGACTRKACEPNIY